MHWQVDGLHEVPCAHAPPQSGAHWQVQLLASAWYVAPQLSAAVSQTQPHTEPEFSKRKPAAQVAFSTALDRVFLVGAGVAVLGALAAGLVTVRGAGPHPQVEDTDV